VVSSAPSAHPVASLQPPQTSNTEGNAASRLLELPAELRTAIWQHALYNKDNVVLPCATPALAQTNRQLRSETMPVFLAVNTVAIRTDMQQYVHDRTFNTISITRRKPKKPVERLMQKRLVAWLEWQEAQPSGPLLADVESFHITIGIVPKPRYAVREQNKHLLSTYWGGTPYIEVFLNFGKDIHRMSPTIRAQGHNCTACDSLGALSDPINDTFEINPSASYRRRPYNVSGLHLTLPGCTVQAIFAIPERRHGSLSVKERHAMQVTWLRGVVSKLQLLVLFGRGKVEYWMKLVGAMEEIFDIVRAQEGGGLYHHPSRAAVEEALGGVKWSGSQVYN